MSVFDTVKGIFSGGEESKPKENVNSPEQQKIVDMVWSDYQVFKEKRQEIEDTWRQEDRFYEGGKRHWEGLRSEVTMKDRPNSVDNVAFSQIESIVSALTAWHPEAQFEGMEQNDEQKAQELTAYFPHELKQIKLKPKHIKAVRRMAIHGLLLYKVVYDPTVEGGRGNYRYMGQNDIIPLEYGSFFPDPRIGDFLYLQDGRAHIIVTPRDVEYFAERFGQRGKLVQEDNQGDDVEIFDQQNKDGNTYKSKRSNLIEYWYRGTPKIMSQEDEELFSQLAEEALAEGKDPSIHLAKAQGQMKGIHCIYISSDGVFLEHKSYVYDHGMYPIVARSLFPIEGSIWPKGYMRDLISPQIMLNKFSELGVETVAKMGNGAIIYEEGAISESKKGLWQRMRSKVGAMLPVSDISKVKETAGVTINPSLMGFMDYYQNMLQKIPRRFDSANGGSNFAGESARHAEALQSAAAGHLSTATELIQDALVEVFEQYIELMAQFYTHERIGRVTGKQVGFSREQMLSQAQTEFETIGQDPMTGEEVPEVLPVVEEYVPKFDIQVSVGVEKPKDRQYWVDTSWMMFDKGLIDPKAVQYVIENGRLEPFSVIEERMQKDAMLQQQLQDQQAQIEQLQGELEQAGNMMMSKDQELEQHRAQADEMSRAKEDDEKQFQRQIQTRKLDIDEMKVQGMMQNQMMRGMGR